MTQFLYPEQMVSSNVTYGIVNRAALAGKKSLRDLSSYTVIIVAEGFTEYNLIRDMADLILTRGCKNITFCGDASEEWQDIFDQEDREINGFNDITGYEDFAVTRRIEYIEDLPEEISSCWNEVLVL